MVSPDWVDEMRTVMSGADANSDDVHFLLGRSGSSVLLDSNIDTLLLP